MSSRITGLQNPFNCWSSTAQLCSTIDSRLMGLGYSRWTENVVQWQSAQEAVNSG